VDEGRSEMRYVMRIAEIGESSKFRTHPALLVLPRARPSERRPIPSHSPLLSLESQENGSWTFAIDSSQWRCPEYKGRDVPDIDLQRVCGASWVLHWHRGVLPLFKSSAWCLTSYRQVS